MDCGQGPSQGVQGLVQASGAAVGGEVGELARLVAHRTVGQAVRTGLGADSEGRMATQPADNHITR